MSGPALICENRKERNDTMPQIFQMPPQMANLIAAGEVVERPGSAAKELVENAVDAGASRITVEIRNGGVTYMRVSDDGKGILPEDVPTAFLRHATSKVRTKDDLEAIGTLGFRGEALAAIAAVCRLDLFTRTADSTEGTHVLLEGGELRDSGAVGCPRGTVVVLRDLFFNVPARAKFLKRDATEGAYVESLISQIAVCHPEVAIRLLKDGRESFSTPGDGKMLSAIYAVGGRELAQRLLPVNGGQAEVQVTGYVAPPEISRAGRAQESFYLNGRYIRSKLLTAAAEEAFKGRMTVGRYPVCYLQVQLHPSAVDVNVHPSKLEVKFAREKEVFSAVYHAVCSALERGDGAQAIRERETALARRDDRPQPEGQVAHGEKTEPIPSAETCHPAPLPSPEMGEQQRLPMTEETPPPVVQVRQKSAGRTLYEAPASGRPLVFAPRGQQAPTALAQQPDGLLYTAREQSPQQKNAAPEVRLLGEAFHTYIIAEDADGLWLIDKHAAHEKLLFDRLKARLGEQSAQLLLTPQSVTLSPGEKQCCLEHQALLEQAGFRLEDFGRGTLLVRAAPMYLEPNDLPFVLSDMAERMQSFRGGENELLEELLKSVACKAAVKAGMVTQPAELQSFARQVLADERLRNCPHGRPCVTYISRYQLEKLFKRVL